jgi:hypothetical protein
MRYQQAVKQDSAMHGMSTFGIFIDKALIQYDGIQATHSGPFHGLLLMQQ